MKAVIKIYAKKNMMNREEQYEGSVSVFFAIVLLVLISFLLSIFDYSRLQMTQIEAISNFQTAAKLSLSDYDPVLLHQYGLLAGEEGIHIDELFQDCLDTQFYPETAKKHDYIVDYLLSDDQIQEDLHLCEVDKYEYELNFYPFLDSNYTELTDQILDYMKFREPYLLVRPFLENLDSIKKSSKSAKVIEEKQELVQQFEQLNEEKKKLYLYLDGIKVKDNGSWNYLSNKDYVRKFSYANNISYKYCSKEIIDAVEDKAFIYTEEFEDFEDDINEIEALLEDILTDPCRRVSTYDPITHERTGYYLKVKSSVKQEINELKDDYLPKIKTYKKAYKWIGNRVEIHNKALETLENYEKLCRRDSEQIQSFREKTLSQDGLLDSVVLQIDSELNQIESELSFDTTDISDKDNLYVIKEILESNLELLMNSQDTLDDLDVYLDDYVYNRFISLLDNSSLGDEEARVIKNRVRRKLKQGPVRQSVSKNKMLRKKRSIDDILSQYNTNCFLDYSMSDTPPVDQDEDSLKEGIEKLKNTDIGQVLIDNGMLSYWPELQIEASQLPSQKIGVSTSEVGSQEPHDYLTVFDQIGNNLGQLHDKMLINEYAIGMFSNYAKAIDINGKTINGYDVDEHFLRYEAEYIIGGSLKEEDNINRVMAYLYGIRTSFNLIHLAMDPGKQELIMNLATAIAGWWSAGVGAVILAAILALAWAFLEAAADVFMLISGKRVPIIKTTSTWYTSIDGDIDKLFVTGVQQVENRISGMAKECKITFEDGIDQLKEYSDEQRKKGTIAALEGIDETLDYFQQEVNEAVEDYGVQMDMYESAFDRKLESYVDNSLRTLLNEQNKSPENPFVGMDGYQLAENIVNEAKISFMQLKDNEQDITHLVTIRAEVMDIYEDKILAVKYHTVSTGFDAVNMLTDIQIEGIKELIDDASKKGVKVTKKAVKAKADEIRKALAEKTKKAEVEKVTAIELIPSLSYEDYLRLYLILPIVDDKTKVARMADLIQMNLQKAYDDYELSLADYFVGIQAKGHVYMDTLFLPNVEEGRLIKTWKVDVGETNQYYSIK